MEQMFSTHVADMCPLTTSEHRSWCDSCLASQSYPCWRMDGPGVWKDSSGFCLAVSYTQTVTEEKAWSVAWAIRLPLSTALSAALTHFSLPHLLNSFDWVINHISFQYRQTSLIFNKDRPEPTVCCVWTWWQMWVKANPRHLQFYSLEIKIKKDSG